MIDNNPIIQHVLSKSPFVCLSTSFDLCLRQSSLFLSFDIGTQDTCLLSTCVCVCVCVCVYMCMTICPSDIVFVDYRLQSVMSKSSLMPLDFFLDLCPFDLYSKTGPSIPSSTPAIAPDVSMIHGMSLTTNTTACHDSQSHQPMFNGELFLSYCPSTSLNIPYQNEASKSLPTLVPCALTQSCFNHLNQSSTIQLCQTINEYLDDIHRLFLHMDTGSDRRMHDIHRLLTNIQQIVQRSLSMQENLLKPLNESSSDMLKLNMFIRSSHHHHHHHHHVQQQQSTSPTLFAIDHRLHDSFVCLLKQLVRLIDSSRSSCQFPSIDLQHRLDSIHEQTHLMHEHLVTITRKLETNII
jgi:hypothetical protein